MKLTLGTAVYDDYDGLFFTLEALRSYHDLARYQAEIVVIDNHPDGPQAPDIKHYVGSIREVPARLVPLREPVGTSAPRDLVFRAAEGEIVLVMDCHVVIHRGGLAALLDFFEEHPEPALVSGPLLAYDRQATWTHFDPVWRGGMWGIWGTDPRGLQPHLPPFTIPAMGLGLFACQKRHWPGFHPLARGFGGEECYIHEKIRQQGGAAWCLPALRWVHRFHNQSRPTAYPNLWRDRVRNYILEFLELGRDVGEIARHFTQEHVVITQAEFDALLAECRREWEAYLTQPIPTTTSTLPPWWPSHPEGTTTAPTHAQKGCGCGRPRAHFSDVQQWHEFERKRSTIPAEILEAIGNYSSGCDIIVDTAANSSSAAAILAIHPQKYIAISPQDPRWWWPQVVAVRGATEVVYLKAEPLRVSVPECDGLIVSGVQTADDLLRILQIYRPHRRALILGTEEWAEFAPSRSGPGLRPGLRKFVRDNPGWVVVKHLPTPPGLTVLSADPADRQTTPGVFKQIANFAKAVAEHMASGAQFVPREVLQQRLDICALCEYRTLDSQGRERCSVCGCPLVREGPVGGKAQWASEDCPLGKWPAPQRQEPFEKVAVA